MLIQFTESLPGYEVQSGRINFNRSNFTELLLQVYEDHQSAVENGDPKILERYLPSPNYARTFLPFVERAKSYEGYLIKGQITGPFTLSSALKDTEGQSIIFNPDLRDLTVKFLTLKALAQVKFLQSTGKWVIIFLDEPALAGFGGSGFLTISKEVVVRMLSEILQVLKLAGAITGIHVCANTSWDLIVEANPDVVSFDSFHYFDKFILYSQALSHFLGESGGFLAWGIVPTEEHLLKTLNTEALVNLLLQQIDTLTSTLRLPKEDLVSQIFFTPACGLGNLSEEKVPIVVKHLKKVKNFFLSHFKGGG